MVVGGFAKGNVDLLFIKDPFWRGEAAEAQPRGANGLRFARDHGSPNNCARRIAKLMVSLADRKLCYVTCAAAEPPVSHLSPLIAHLSSLNAQVPGIARRSSREGRHITPRVQHRPTGLLPSTQHLLRNTFYATTSQAGARRPRSLRRPPTRPRAFPDASAVPHLTGAQRGRALVEARRRYRTSGGAASRVNDT